MADLIQSNLALEKRLDKHGSWLYNLKNLNIPQKVSQAVNEIVTDAVDWAMQAPLRARFSDLPAVDIKEVLQQRMFEDSSYQAHEDHKNLFEALEKSPPSQPPTPPPPAGASGALCTSEASGSSQFPSPPPPPSNGTSGSTQQQGNYLMNDDSIPEEHVQLSNDEDTGNDHLPNADMRKGWWKPLSEEERPATPEPAWTIPSSNVSNIKNNWASALVSSYEPPAENSLLAKIGDMTTFINWYYQQVNKTVLTQTDFEGKAYEVENPEGDQVRIDVSRPMPLGGPPVSEQMWIDEVCTYDISVAYGISHWWFNRQKFYIERHASPSHRRAVRTHMRILSVVRIKAYSRYRYDYLSKIVLRRADFQEHKIAKKDFKNLYPNDFEDLNLLLLLGHLDHLSGSDKLWDAKGYEFKHDYTIIESPRAVVFPVNNNERKIMRFNKIYKFSDGTLTRILEALDYRVKEFKIKRLNPGMNTRLWTQKDVTRSKEFMSAIERRLKTRRIYQNLECFVGGHICDIDYRLLQRTK
ncbi:hypothetical protein Tco_1270989 [Tanacetum coccineum]